MIAYLHFCVSVYNMEIKLIRCPKCNSGKTRVRIKTNELVCEQCGNISENPYKPNGDNK